MVTICTAVEDLSTPVTTSAWTQLTLKDESGNTLSPNVIPYHVNQITVSNSSGSVIAFGVGVAGSGSAKRAFIINPSEILEHPALLSPGLAVFVKAMDVDADQGKLAFTFQKGKA